MINAQDGHADYEKLAPKVPPSLPAQTQSSEEKTAPPADEELISQLRVIVLAGKFDDLSKEEKSFTHGVYIIGSLNQLRNPQELTDRLSALYIDKPLNQARLSDLLATIIEIYKKQNRPVVAVTLAPQDITDGVLRVDVTEAVLGNIVAKDGKYFSAEYIKEEINLKSGQPIDTSILLQDLNWLNSNPFRRIDALFSQGQEFGQANIELNITDSKPYRFFAGYENTGSEVTDKNRYFAGFNWGKAFWTDADVLSYQYTMAPDSQTLSGHSLQYLSLLPWHHTAMLYGSYSEVSPDLDNNLESKGESKQVGMRYNIPLYSPYSVFTHGVLFGGDYKNSNNNLEFGGTVITDSAVDTVTLTAGYTAKYTQDNKTLTGTLEFYHSPGDITAHNTDEIYALSRNGASADFNYLKAALNGEYTFENNAQLAALVNAQWSGGSLLSGEQMGFGGYNTVRGYDDRVLNTDKGLLLSLEARTKPLSLFDPFLPASLSDQLRFISFIDYGVGANNNRLTGERHSTVLLSTGLGVRYNMSTNVSLRADYGWRLKDYDGQTTGGRGQPHIGFIMSY